MNIAILVQAISLLSSAIPIFAGLITQVETLMPNAGGVDKFKVVEAAIIAYFKKICANADVLAHILPKVGATINSLVAMFNAAGVFTKSAASVNKLAGEAQAAVAVSESAAAAVAALSP